MTDHDLFPIGRDAARARLDAFLPKAGRVYAAGRNTDTGPGRREAVSGLSPYIRRRLVTEEEVLRAVRTRHSFSAAEKFIQEVFWRSYFKGWLERRPSVWRDYRSRLAPDRAAVEATALRQAEAGETGIACFDSWARELVETGYLHNHARMWFASIWIFTLRLPWTLGAEFFLRHLLDGDPASNTLSWRWVGGLHSRGKTYLARESNIAKFTDGRFPHTPGLAREAPPLQEDFDPGPPAPVPMPSPPTAGARTGLLLTEEDLAPAPVWPDATATAALASQAEGQGPRAYGNACLTDRLPHGPHLADAAAIVDWAEAEGLAQVVTAYVPVGPTADALDAAKGELSARGIALMPILRDYDRLCWPHATKGYFAFKKHIPGILGELGL